MPLARDVLLPELLSAAREGEPESLRWLVHAQLDPAMRTDIIVPSLHQCSRFVGLLAAALARNPEALDLWRHAFNYELSPAEWGMHHLDEGVLLVSEEECGMSLQRAREVARTAPDGALVEQDQADLHDLEIALEDYCAWRAAGGQETLSRWRAERGRANAWPIPIYCRSSDGSTSQSEH
jgi:hypothetical protein